MELSKFAVDARKAFDPLSEDAVYLDSAAGTLPPREVIAAVTRHLATVPFAPYRSAHLLGEQATSAYDKARAQVADFLNADRGEILFFSNATAALNFVASSVPFMMRRSGEPGSDEIVVLEGEHYSNLLPWTVRRPAKPVVVPVDAEGEVSPDRFAAALSPTTRLVAVSLVSHVTGVVRPLAAYRAALDNPRTLLLVDAVSAAGRIPIDVRELGCDFLVTAGPSLYGVPGAAALFIRRSLMDTFRPALAGAGTAHRVDAGGTFVTPTDLPMRFEAGRQNVAAALGLAAGASLLERLGRTAVAEHEVACAQAMLEIFARVPHLRVLGPAAGAAVGRVGIISFVIEGKAPPFIQGWLSDRERIYVSGGQLSAFPMLGRMGAGEAVRVSTSVFTGPEDLARLEQALHRLVKAG